MGKETCYRCQYADKIKISPIKKCKQCGKDVPHKRWTYCSEKCGELAAKIQKKTEWTKLVPTNGKKGSACRYNPIVPEF